MVKTLLAVISVIACCTASGAGFLEEENDKRPPIEAYLGDVKAGITICGLEMELALLKDEKAAYEKAYQCIDDAKKAFKKRYETAVKVVRKPQAKIALKEHLVTAITAVSALPPASDETKAGYTKRQADLKDKLTEKWARFEVEN
jgi:hypothetical protein